MTTTQAKIEKWRAVADDPSTPPAIRADVLETIAMLRAMQARAANRAPRVHPSFPPSHFYGPRA